MEHRRRVPRQPPGWRGLCLIEAESAAGWHDCRVIDISMFGLGITLRCARPPSQWAGVFQSQKSVPGRRAPFGAIVQIPVRTQGVVAHADDLAFDAL